MADEYIDVNKKAHEGGDTAPHVAKEIAKRNKAADKLAEASREHAVKLREMSDEHEDKMRKAMDEYGETVGNPALVEESKAGKK